MENEIESLKARGVWRLLRNNSDIKNEITLDNKDIKGKMKRMKDLQKSINSINGNKRRSVRTF